ncbi:E3 ubiquitin-protein ligase RNF166 [Octopus bimaculoides]|uniref:RING-type domain-containing protein n=1 Tax=Octopus bimaculoides TaxID=37653 RepID=A0A0L8GXK8_OCTBM|nr:E3 ubiquitin-protein ligase RNF166 [Octopus bimaculoides]|eukprot:XP_014777482.1 PREDICTED: RING finger protein 166-like [Octopus bimaculoides]
MDDFDDLCCSVCLDIFEKPLRVPCKHVFCMDCISLSMALAEPKCPVCRTVFNPRSVHTATDIQARISNTEGTCQWCVKKMSLSKLKQHSMQCSKMDKKMPQFKPVAPTSQPCPSNVPNRSTFQCPYCGVRNLDCPSFVQHCLTHHSTSNAKVVCPICTSMPWGDPHRLSANFIRHLSLRHRFEYDTFVDFSKHEQEMIEEAIKASLQEQ